MFYHSRCFSSKCNWSYHSYQIAQAFRSVKRDIFSQVNNHSCFFIRSIKYNVLIMGNYANIYIILLIFNLSVAFFSLSVSLRLFWLYPVFFIKCQQPMNQVQMQNNDQTIDLAYDSIIEAFQLQELSNRLDIPFQQWAQQLEEITKEIVTSKQLHLPYSKIELATLGFEVASFQEFIIVMLMNTRKMGELQGRLSRVKDEDILDSFKNSVRTFFAHHSKTVIRLLSKSVSCNDSTTFYLISTIYIAYLSRSGCPGEIKILEEVVREMANNHLKHENLRPQLIEMAPLTRIQLTNIIYNGEQVILNYITALRQHFNLPNDEEYAKSIYDRLMKELSQGKSTSNVYDFNELLRCSWIRGMIDVKGNIYLDLKLIMEDGQDTDRGELKLLFVYLHEIRHRIRVYSCGSEHSKSHIFQFTPELPGESGSYLTDTLRNIVDGLEDFHVKSTEDIENTFLQIMTYELPKEQKQQLEEKGQENVKKLYLGQGPLFASSCALLVDERISEEALIQQQQCKEYQNYYHCKIQ